MVSSWPFAWVIDLSFLSSLLKLSINAVLKHKVISVSIIAKSRYDVLTSYRCEAQGLKRSYGVQFLLSAPLTWRLTMATACLSI